MRTAVWILVWIACVLVGAGLGYLAGYGLWKLGFEIIGSAVALVGAGVGGISRLLVASVMVGPAHTARGYPLRPLKKEKERVLVYSNVDEACTP